MMSLNGSNRYYNCAPVNCSRSSSNAAEPGGAECTATRTELDWAMRHGRISVWAPSRIVLDAVDGPSARPDDALALAVWFAGAMQAAELVVLGSDAPVEAAMPVRRGLP